MGSQNLGDKLRQSWIVLDDLVNDDADLLADLAYGFSESLDPYFVMGVPALQPASSGMLPTNEILFDYDLAS